MGVVCCQPGEHCMRCTPRRGSRPHNILVCMMAAPCAGPDISHGQPTWQPTTQS